MSNKLTNMMRSIPIVLKTTNYSRSTMSEERLNGLGQLYINWDILLDYGAVIKEFGKFNRRLSFA